MLELYKNIKTIRKERGLSQAELAKRTGYTDRSSIAKIEKGGVDLPQSKIMVFAKALGVSPGELMGDVESTEAFGIDALVRAAQGCPPEYIKSAVQLLRTLKETRGGK